MAASRFIDQARFSEPRKAVGAAPLRSLVPWYVGQSTAIGSRVVGDDGEVDVGPPAGGAEAVGAGWWMRAKSTSGRRSSAGRAEPTTRCSRRRAQRSARG